MAGLCGKILKAEYAPPSSIARSIPAAVEAIIARCLKKNPSSRYQSAEEILRDIDDIDRLQADRTAGQRAKAQPGWNRPALFSAAAALAIAALVGLFVLRESAPTRVESLPAQQTKNAAQIKSDLRTIRINTLEGQAEVYRDGQFIGMTPCYIEARLGERVVLTLKRNGFSDEKVEFLVTEAKKEYTIVMKPIAK
jgi:serine/threonine protein kinase